MADATFETYYASGLGAKYATRAWIISAVILAVGVPVTWFTFVGNPQWWVLVLVGLVFAFLLAVTIGAAVIAPAKWGTDGRLAVRLDETGMTLPHIGTLAWDEIASIGIVDTGFVHGNVAFRAWEVLTGSSNNRFVTVWLKDPAAVLTRIGDPVGGIKEVAEAYSFRGVFGEGLRSPGWDETMAALQQAAVRHGIELPGRKNPAVAEAGGLLAQKGDMTERRVWFTDRYGREIEDDVTVERLDGLLETIAEPDGDDEHASISVSDSDSWNLEYYRGSLLFQSLEGGEVGILRDLDRDERLAVGAEFLAGDFDALNARPWADR